MALAGFGLDSLVEIAASAVVIWELSATGQQRQRQALRLIGGAFVALAIYITVQSIYVIVIQDGAAGSGPSGVGHPAGWAEPQDGEEPTVPSLSQRDVVVGMDVSKNVIVAGVLGAGDEVPVVESFTHDEASVRRFFGRFEQPARVAACYEAGPTGFELHRW